MASSFKSAIVFHKFLSDKIYSLCTEAVSTFSSVIVKYQQIMLVYLKTTGKISTRTFLNSQISRKYF